MTDIELTNIYTESYVAEYDKQFKLSHTFYEKATDKLYALQLGFFAVSISYGFRNSTDLDKSINDLYVHAHKLGVPISEVINEIPNLTREYLIKKQSNELNHKNEVTIKWVKFLRLIPYKIKTIRVKGAIKYSSRFEKITEIEDIAVEFGIHRAILDIHSQLKLKFLELGKIADNTQNLTQTIEEPILLKLKTSLLNNDLETFFNILQGLFATLSYNMKISEAYFHSHIHIILKLCNIAILSEVETNEGRIDSVTESEKFIHIFEFKLTDSKIVLNQIKENNYYQSYFNSSKEIILVGVAFDKNKKNITNWTSEKFSP